MTSTPNVIGIEGLSASFKKVGSDMELRMARRMVVAGGKVLKDGAKKIVVSAGRVKTGAMVKNIALKREPKAGKGVEQYHLGVRHGQNLSKKIKEQGSKLRVSQGKIVKSYKDDPYYWRWQELGWIPKGPGKALRGSDRKKNEARKASSHRKIPGIHFIKGSLDANHQQAIAAMGQALMKELERQGK